MLKKFKIEKEKSFKNYFRVFFGFLFLMILFISIVSAGVGISWDKETSLVPENTKTCLTYKVYNPWQDDSYARVRLSEELMEIMTSTSSETIFIPKDTSSAESLPIEFCFKTPKFYKKDCALFNTFLCKQDCLEDMKIFSGEVEVIEVDDPDILSGTGGSATKMSISAPLKIKIQCIKHKRNYSLIYILVAVISGFLLARNLRKNKSKQIKRRIKRKEK